MGDLLRIVGVAIVISVILTVLRGRSAPFGSQVSIGFVVAVFIWLLGPLGEVTRTLSTLADQAGLRSVYIQLLLKAVGIAAITSIGSALCRDTGENAIGQMVEFAGKVFILLLALPVVAAIIDVIVQLLPG